MSLAKPSQVMASISIPPSTRQITIISICQYHYTIKHARLTFTRTVALNADPDSIEITGKGIYEGMRVRRGKIVTFTANPAETGAPEPFTGDIRYEPVKWKVNPSGDFKTGYTQSFSTKDMALGDHTLKVIYNQERYNGNAWKETGESVDKTLNFILEGDEAITHPQSSTPQGNSGNPKVKASGIPQTGDSGFGLYLIAIVFTASLMLLLLKNRLRWRRSV